MLNKKIIFSAPEEYLNTNQERPIPVKLNLPEWYKKLEYTVDNNTIKGCIPFLDSLTTGYLLKTPIDYQIKHNVYHKPSKRMVTVSRVPKLADHLNFNINKNNNKQMHSLSQVGFKCPFAEKNNYLAIHKFMNPWLIQTPPGYSCLFVPPLNNEDDRFSIIPGIVDTDTYYNNVNFPFIINSYKYPTLDTLIKRGTPYVQIIPFKRDNWKMECKPLNKGKLFANLTTLSLSFIHKYKNFFWNKKTFK